MGRMIDGQWIADTDVGQTSNGEFKRTPSVLRNWISNAKDADFPAESGRYHLFVAWNCPWAHRTVLMRALKGLESHIGLSVAAPARTDQGWVFGQDDDYKDVLFGSKAIYEIYARGSKNYTGRATVPILYDTKKNQIVSNESADIVRMLGQAFKGIANEKDFYPEELRSEIDAWNERIHSGLNNGVYRAGFATTQKAYDDGVRDVFDTLDALEERLSNSNFIVGEQLTEADIRLFPTLVRFDVAYYSAFKCNRNRLIDFPHLWTYARKMLALPGVKETVFFDIYRKGYNSPSAKRNIYGIVPVAPDIVWEVE